MNISKTKRPNSDVIQGCLCASCIAAIDHIVLTHCEVLHVNKHNGTTVKHLCSQILSCTTNWVSFPSEPITEGGGRSESDLRVISAWAFPPEIPATQYKVLRLLLAPASSKRPRRSPFRLMRGLSSVMPDVSHCKSLVRIQPADSGALDPNPKCQRRLGDSAQDLKIRPGMISARVLAAVRDVWFWSLGFMAAILTVVASVRAAERAADGGERGQCRASGCSSRPLHLFPFYRRSCDPVDTLPAVLPNLVLWSDCLSPQEPQSRSDGWQHFVLPSF